MQLAFVTSFLLKHPRARRCICIRIRLIAFLRFILKPPYLVVLSLVWRFYLCPTLHLH